MGVLKGIIRPYLVFFTLSWVSLNLLPISGKRSTYIVHMDKSLMPKAFSSHQNWYSSTIDSLKFTNQSSLIGNPSSSPSLLYIYNNALHGFSVVLSVDELEALKKSRGFIFSYPDSTMMRPHTTHTPEFLYLNPTTGLMNASNYGKHIIIEVIDSGIWPESPSFKDDGIIAPPPTKWKGSCKGGQDFNSSMCNKKLIGARYFNEAMKAQKKGSFHGVDSARDDSRHGTAVSTIAGGNYVKGTSFFGYAEGTAKGVAPHARVAAYKASWLDKAVPSDIIAAIDKAIEDGVDVICFSLTPKERMNLYDSPLTIATFRAMEKGIVVSTSAGNSGPYYKTVENDIPWVLTVTAGTIDRQIGGTLIMGNGLKMTGWSMFHGTSVQNMKIFYSEDLSKCTRRTALSQALDGIIICNIGHVYKQIKYLVNTKLSALILIAHEPDFIGFLNVSYPYILIGPEEGQSVITYAKNNDKPFASMQFQQTFIGVKPAPIVPSFASRGPSMYFPNVLMKPAIMAPGSLVLASVNGAYEIISGTSFASPHVAGVAALLKSAHPEWSATAVKSAIMTTANILDNEQRPIEEYRFGASEMASPLAMGAGHIEPNKALDPGLVYDATPQDYVNLLCSFQSYKENIKKITGSDNYSCSNPSSDLNYPTFFISYNYLTIPRLNFQRTVTNVGEGATTYNATVTAPEGFNVTIMPKTLVFGRKYEDITYTLTLSSEKIPVSSSFGQLIWAEENRKHHVRSLIVVIVDDFL